MDRIIAAVLMLSVAALPIYHGENQTLTTEAIKPILPICLIFPELCRK